ncbi:MAG TPA: L,D-transpeptidase [Patescibacteria group bacterium]
MHSFIPHKDNPHRVRKIFGAIAVISVSVAATFFIQAHLRQSRPNAKAQQVKAPDPTKATDASFGYKTEAQQPALESQPTPENSPLAVVDDGKPELTQTQQAAIEKVPIVRDKNPATRLEEAKTYAKPQILDGKYIDISLSHQNMVLFENGQAVDAYLISSGKRGYDTPIGTYQIQNKVPRAWSRTYSLFMPHWMALVSDGKFGIHELPVWPGGYQEGANHLGIPVSHGCVRLGVGPAKRVYDWADVGTTVIVHK